tara:strand:- start:6288 stop:7148 length:861 start_codon:yes stop_codon:yes gene_type:complete
MKNSISSQIELISKISKEKNILILGMQKCGSGTISKYTQSFENIIWADHGTFWDEQDAKKCYVQCLNSGGIRVELLRRRFVYKKDAINVAIIRNPYDLMVSTYFHSDVGANNVAAAFDRPCSTVEGFKKFIYGIKNNPKFHFTPFQMGAFYPYYTSRGVFAPDVAIKLEFLQDIIDYRNTKCIIDIDKDGKKVLQDWAEQAGLVRHASRRPSKNNFDIYDDEMISIMEDVFRYELATFGYDINGVIDDKVFIQKINIENIPEERLLVLERIRKNKRWNGFDQVKMI